MSESAIDEHLKKFATPQRKALLQTTNVIRRALPGAVEVISYGMPTFKADNVAVVGLDGFTDHNSLFPYSGSVIELVRTELPHSPASKGTLHFPADEAFPAALLRRILQVRIREINQSFPKKSGETKQFNDNGRLKLTGKLKGDQMHGAWQWFRRDGTVMRAGSFRNGVRSGEWTTFDRSGRPVKVTRF